jgi:hypothetical protein
MAMKQDIKQALDILDGLYCGLTNTQGRKLSAAHLAHNEPAAKRLDAAIRILRDLETGDFEPAGDFELAYISRRREQV